MNIYFITSLFFSVFLLIIIWGLKNLSRDEFQFFCAIPYKKIEENTYEGTNITFYGIISALSCSASVFLFLVLIKFIDFPLKLAYFILITIFLTGLYASRTLAYIIEKRKDTLTIGGATFVSGIISVPLIYFFIKSFNINETYFLPVLTALTTSYTFGEGLGRLACISFGCCYGKPAERYPKLPKILKIKFFSETKKAVYDSNYKNLELINIQGIVVCLFTILAILSVILIMLEKFKIALLISFTMPAIVRFFSEFFRDDNRGINYKLSTYQFFSLILVIYSLIFLYIFKPLETKIYIKSTIFFSNTELIILTALFFTTLIHSGVSKVTASKISFNLKKSS